MASIRWTVGASEDLRDIVEHIARDSPAYARATGERVLAAVKLLRRHPRLGRIVPEYEDETVRELLVGNYRVVYRLLGQRIGIVAIVHGARDLLRHLGDAPWDFR